MVQLALFLGLAASVSQAFPLEKRIDQNIADSTTGFEEACLAAGGGEKCNPIAVAAFGTLLAGAGPCDQQDHADAMIDFAKTLKNNEQVIFFSKIFAQQARNTPTSESVQFCQKAPTHSELDGLFQCQFAGANPRVFVGGVAAGQPGTIPFNATTTVQTGGCPAHPQGPIPDGSQLVDIVKQGGGATTGSQKSAKNTSPNSNPAATTTPSNSVAGAAIESADTTPTESAATTPTGSAATTPTESSGFQLQNGQDAQALNKNFGTLTADSSCTDGENACVGGGFAQCVNGKFTVTQCGSGLGCFALPLVNSKGTSITCTTSSDAEARIAATGAPGGITGA